VLNLGCGPGGETAGFAQDGAAAVFGIDIEGSRLKAAARFAAKTVPGGPIMFARGDGNRLPFRDGTFDIVTMRDVMEHLERPLDALLEARRVLAPGGRIHLSFGPLWYSPWGGHMFTFIYIPWLHLLAPQRTVLGARSFFRSDGARTYEQAGVFKMTVGKFRRLLDQCGMDVEYLHLRATKNLRLALKFPVLRELMCSEIACTLRK